MRYFHPPFLSFFNHCFLSSVGIFTLAALKSLSVTSNCRVLSEAGSVACHLSCMHCKAIFLCTADTFFLKNTDILREQIAATLDSDSFPAPHPTYPTWCFYKLVCAITILSYFNEVCFLCGAACGAETGALGLCSHLRWQWFDQGSLWLLLSRSFLFSYLLSLVLYSAVSLMN